MRIGISLVAIFLIGINSTSWAQSTTGHGGHGGSGGAGTDDGCIKAKISRYTPENLSSVAPGSDYSFAVSGSNGPGHIHVTIKQEPVTVQVEDKDSFYLVKGKLPESIKNSVVRISVKAKAKNSKCDADGGWLLKVTE